MTEPMDMTVLAQDEALFEALGRGDPPPAGDDVAMLLAAWRADLTDTDTTVRPAIPPVVGISRPRRRRWLRAALAAAAVVVGLLGGLTIAAGGAGPDSPLWAITRLLYTDRADSRAAQQEAERAIADARSAVASADYPEASRLLDVATVQIGRITDPTVAQRLRDEVEAIRRLLPLSTLPSLTPGPSPGPSSSLPGGGGAPGGGGGPGGSGGPGGGGGPGLPVPSLPLPSLPSLPLPPLPLPSVSVSLPI